MQYSYKTSFNFTIYKTILPIISLMSCSYWFVYSLFGMGTKIDKIVNITLVCSLVFIVSLNVLLKAKIYLPKEIRYFFIMVIFMFFTGLLNNSPIEYLPSLLRYSLYILLFSFSYFVSYYYNKIHFEKINYGLSKFIFISVILTLGFCFVEIINDKRIFINGMYRSSGQFYLHPLALALFLNVIIILWNESILKTSIINYKKIINFCVLFLLLYFLLATGSRIQIVSISLSYILLRFIKVRGTITAMKFFVFVIILLLSLYVVLSYTNTSPRMSRIINYDFREIFDSSTMLRYKIIIDSISNMKLQDYIIGIGLGGFPEFYSEISGMKKISAHNNYLLFLVEGGIIGLLLYILFQIKIFRYFLKQVKKNDSFKINEISLLLFLSIHFFSFLQNNYYFFISESIVWICYGISFGQKNQLRSKQLAYNRFSTLVYAH